MRDHDVPVGLSLALLRASGHEIEALSLHALAQETDTDDLVDALAGTSERRAGAFGLEIVGAILIPVLIEATKQFWNAYSKEVIQAAAEAAGKTTIDAFKAWFKSAESETREKAASDLADRIRAVGLERGLGEADIAALIAAAQVDRLEEALYGPANP